MTLDPARPEKTRRGVWGGVAPPVGLGFGMRPPPGSGSARITRNYPSGSKKGYGFGSSRKCRPQRASSNPTRPPNRYETN